MIIPLKHIGAMTIIKTIYALVLLLPLFCAQVFSAQQEITLANGEWEPWHSEHLPYYGLASRIVTEAFALENTNVNYKFYPWKRGYREALSGRIDGTFLWTKNPQREELFYYSQPVLAGKTVIFHLKKKIINWETSKDLKKYRVGATSGYNYGEEFGKFIKSADVQFVPNDKQNFKKLLHERIDIFFLDINVGNTMLKALYPPETIALFTSNPLPIRKTDYYLLFSKENPNSQSLLKKFNLGLSKLIKNGTLQRFIDESH